MTQLQGLTQQKLTALLGDELELRRQLQQIEWVESFAGSAAAALPASRFLSIWRAHAALRAELQQAIPMRATQEVLPDLQLRGGVSVTASDQVLGVALPAGPAAVAPTFGYAAQVPIAPTNPGYNYEQPAVVPQPPQAPPPGVSRFREGLFAQPAVAAATLADAQSHGAAPHVPQQPTALPASDYTAGRWRPTAALSAASFLTSPATEGADGSPYIRSSGRY